MPMLTQPTEASAPPRDIDIAATLGWYRHGPGDPTTWMTAVGTGATSHGDFVRATHTPDGPGTIHVQWRTPEPSAERSLCGVDPEVEATSHVSEPLPGVHVRAYGAGAAWLVRQAPLFLGLGDCDDHGLATVENSTIASAARSHPDLRFGASGTLYHELLPTIIEQRITIGEAHRQWAGLCRALGEPAPGPFSRLVLPPTPRVLARQPSWWFHPIGIERKRAEPLKVVATHASKYWDWTESGPVGTRTKLELLRGIGVWTIGSVLGPALGDPDAVAVGDFHLKNTVSYALAGEPRGSDERMLELLEPYTGQRGRVVRLLRMSGHGAPRFGPRKRILPMHAW